MPELPRSPDDVPRVTAHRAVSPPDLDGRLAAACWRDAPPTSRFVDLVSGAATSLDTRAALLWDDEHLYVGFRLEARGVVATLTERDAHIWLDDDVELFVAGPDAYYELEINALGTVYEVLFVWDDVADRAPFDAVPTLRRDHPQAAPFDGVDLRHPRGPRTGFWGFDLPGLRTAVAVDGPLEAARAWSVEIAIPWAGLTPLAGGRALTPRDGDEWRIALARFNTRTDGPEDSGGWSWSPHGVWDSHVPELFPVVTFSSAPPPRRR